MPCIDTSPNVGGADIMNKEVRHMDDSKIIEQFFERNENALKETEAKYGRLCASIARNILRDKSDQEECLNDIYLSLWNTIPPEHPRNFAAFIAKLARNICLKRVEFNTALKRTPEAEISISELEDILPDKNAEFDIADEELGKLISRFLMTENEDARNVFLRKYWFFDSIKDIAKGYGFTQSKVKSMLYHTRERLKKYLEKEGIKL